MGEFDEEFRRFDYRKLEVESSRCTGTFKGHIWHQAYDPGLTVSPQHRYPASPPPPVSRETLRLPVNPAAAATRRCLLSHPPSGISGNSSTSSGSQLRDLTCISPLSPSGISSNSSTSSGSHRRGYATSHVSHCVSGLFCCRVRVRVTFFFTFFNLLTCISLLLPLRYRISGNSSTSNGSRRRGYATRWCGDDVRCELRPGTMADGWAIAGFDAKLSSGQKIGEAKELHPNCAT